MEKSSLGNTIVDCTRFLLCCARPDIDLQRFHGMVRGCFDCGVVAVGKYIGGETMTRDDFWFAVVVFTALVVSAVGLAMLYLHTMPVLINP